jgi:hypothetical protein
MMFEAQGNEPIDSSPMMSPPSAIDIRADPPLSPSSGQSSPRSPLELVKEFTIGTPTLKSPPVVSLSSPVSSPVKKDYGSCIKPVPGQPADFLGINCPASTKKTKRSVTFGNTVHYREIRHLKDYSHEEITALWLGQDEYQMIKAVVKMTVMMMMRGQAIAENDLDLSTRGLEFRTKSGSKVRQRSKLRARSAVLNEQDLQRDEGYYDPQFIAMVCIEESLEGRQGARGRALYDEVVIKSYLQGVRAQWGSFQ